MPENGAALINICITQVPNVTAAGLLNEVAIAIKHAVLVDFHSFPELRKGYQMLLLEGWLVWVEGQIRGNLKQRPSCNWDSRDGPTARFDGISLQACREGVSENERENDDAQMMMMQGENLTW